MSGFPGDADAGREGLFREPWRGFRASGRQDGDRSQPDGGDDRRGRRPDGGALRRRRPLRGPGRLRARPRPGRSHGSPDEADPLHLPARIRGRPVAGRRRGRPPGAPAAGRRPRLRPRGRRGAGGVRRDRRREGRTGTRPLVARLRGHAGRPRRDLRGDGRPPPRRRQDRGDRALGGRPRPSARLRRRVAPARPGPGWSRSPWVRSASPRASSAAATARRSRSPRPRTVARPPRASCRRPRWPTSTASASIGPATRVYGLLGSDVLRSLSPAIQNRAFAATRHGRRLRSAAGRVDGRLRRGPARPRALRLQRDAPVQGRDPASPRLGHARTPPRRGRRTRSWRRTAGSSA